jgi:hypothetical protein
LARIGQLSLQSADQVSELAILKIFFTLDFLVCHQKVLNIWNVDYQLLRMGLQLLKQDFVFILSLDSINSIDCILEVFLEESEYSRRLIILSIRKFLDFFVKLVVAAHYI